MRDLWKAFVARLVYLLTPKQPVPPPAPIFKTEPPLTPGTCVCLHNRSGHEKGIGKCHCAFPPHSKFNESSDWWMCACQIYIPKKDDDDEAEEPETPSPSELEALYKR